MGKLWQMFLNLFRKPPAHNPPPPELPEDLLPTPPKPPELPKDLLPTPPEKPVMLILRGIRNQLDEASAREYARKRGYEGKVLDVSGETGPNSDQVRWTIKEFRRDPRAKALYGFSGGGYNVRHVINAMPRDLRSRIALLVVIGAPKNPKKLYEGPWELVYRLDPPEGHMAGPRMLLKELDNKGATA